MQPRMPFVRQRRVRVRTSELWSTSAPPECHRRTRDGQSVAARSMAGGRLRAARLDGRHRAAKRCDGWCNSAVQRAMRRAVRRAVRWRHGTAGGSGADGSRSGDMSPAHLRAVPLATLDAARPTLRRLPTPARARPEDRPSALGASQHPWLRLAEAVEAPGAAKETSQPGAAAPWGPPPSSIGVMSHWLSKLVIEVNSPVFAPSTQAAAGLPGEPSLPRVTLRYGPPYTSAPLLT